LRVQVHTNTAAHAHDHRFPFECGRPFFEVGNQVPGYNRETFISTNHGFERGPFRLKFFAVVDEATEGEEVDHREKLTTASSAAHFVLSFSRWSTSSPSVASSKSASTFGFNA